MVECGWLSERLRPYIDEEKVVDPSDEFFHGKSQTENVGTIGGVP